MTAVVYLPREVFFGRLGFAGAFFAVWASDFGRFLPATLDSFPVDVLPGTLLVKTIDKHYGHLARDSEAAIRARLDARDSRRLTTMDAQSL